MAPPTSAVRMNLLTLMDASVYHHIYDNVAHNELTGSIRVSVQFPTGALKQPACVVINAGDYIDSIFEIGGSAKANVIYTLDIYGQTKTQRDDLAWLTKMYLDDEYIPLKDYNESWPDYSAGYPPSNTPSTLTDMEVVSITLPSPPDIPPVGEAPDKLRYWRQVIFTLDFIVPSDYRP